VNASDTANQARADGKPDLDRLYKEYSACVNRRDGLYWQRQRTNRDSRYCMWPGQSWDGRKRAATAGNKSPFPWLNAADSRVHLVDMVVRQDVASLMQVWSRMRITAQPTEPAADAGWANRVTSLLRWMLYQNMEEAEDEAELLANWYRERGAAAMLVTWDREEALAPRRITMNELEQAAIMAGRLLEDGRDEPPVRQIAALPGMIEDPTLEDEAVQAMELLSQGRVRRERLRQAVNDLRRDRMAVIPVPEVVRDRPRLKALAWNEDILVPAEVVDLQRSRVVFIREFLTEIDLQARAASGDYDADWVDMVIQKCRGVTTWDTPYSQNSNRVLASQRLSIENTDDLYEVTTAFERLYDEDEVPGIWLTTFAPSQRYQGRSREADMLVGQHELIEHANNQFPIVVFQTEHRSRLPDDARGTGELGFTWQQAIKRQWDARSDRSDLATLPPYYYPPGEEPDAWGPGVGIPTLQPGSFGYFDPPKPDSGSKEFEQTVWMFALEFFGRGMAPGQPPTPEAAAVKQDMVRGWLKGWRRTLRMVLQLQQQFGAEEVFVAVTGDHQGRPLSMSRKEIQGQFDLALKFTATDLDVEFVKPKIELLEKALSLDRNGIVDYDEALKCGIELVDPTYADRIIRPGEAATQQEVADEQAILAQLLQGIMVDVQPGQAYALRKGTLEKLIQGNPTAQRTMTSDPNVAAAVSRRWKQLNFHIQQQQINPDIGRRLGTKPNPQLNPEMAQVAAS
jgi:hypothetical protein